MSYESLERQMADAYNARDHAEIGCFVFDVVQGQYAHFAFMSIEDLIKYMTRLEQTGMRVFAEEHWPEKIVMLNLINNRIDTSKIRLVPFSFLSKHISEIN